LLSQFITNGKFRGGIARSGVSDDGNFSFQRKNVVPDDIERCEQPDDRFHCNVILEYPLKEALVMCLVYLAIARQVL
jgi:hypothetical protein